MVLLHKALVGKSMGQGLFGENRILPKKEFWKNSTTIFCKKNVSKFACVVETKQGTNKL